MKHKVFLSFYHGDQDYKEYFEKAYGHLVVPKSVTRGDILPTNSADYIKQLIKQDYISDSSIVVVLVGPETRKRKHVDWEIYAGLDPRSNGVSGLVGVLLPTFPLDRSGRYDRADLPPRLDDNVQSKYAGLTTWRDFMASSSVVQQTLDSAFARRKTSFDRVRNSRVQMSRNL